MHPDVPLTALSARVGPSSLLAGETQTDIVVTQNGAWKKHCYLNFLHSHLLALSISRRLQGGEQDDEFALDEDDERGDGRQRGRSRAAKAAGSKGKNKGEKDPW